MGIIGDISQATFDKVNFGGLFTGLGILMVTLLIVAIVGGIIFFFFTLKKYKYKITIFENIAGQGYVPVGKDRAKIVKVGDQGDEILLLQKRKVFRQAYGRKIGKNHYAFAIGKDGYWRNITFGDIDVELNKLGIKPIDRDMRYMHVAIRKSIKDRYEKKNWLKENFAMLVQFGFMVIIFIFLWLIFREFGAITSAAAGAVEAAGEVQDSTRQLLVALDNIIAGSGIRGS